MDLNGLLGIAGGRMVTGLFIFARLGALLSAVPLMSSKSVPVPLRIGFSGALALILAPLAAPSRIDGIPLILVGMAKELIVGLILGWTASLFFAAAQMAGEWLDLQSGFQASQLVNPMFDTQNAVLGNFSYVVAGLVFLGSGGYAIVLRAAVSSLAISPPGILRLGPGTPDDWTALVGQVVWIAVQLAAPVAAALFLAEVAVGFISRAMPQANIMMLTLPAKSALALGVFALSLPALARAMEIVFGRMNGTLGGVLHAIGG